MFTNKAWTSTQNNCPKSFISALPLLCVIFNKAFTFLCPAHHL